MADDRNAGHGATDHGVAGPRSHDRRVSAMGDRAHDDTDADTATSEPADPDTGADVLATDAELRAIKEHSRRKTLGIRVASAVVLLGIVAAMYYALGEYGLDLAIAAIGAICFFELIFLIIKATQNVAFRLASIIAGGAYIGLAVLILISFDIQPLYITLATVIFADIFAYGFGTLIGGPRILPRVSPNKTWAGLFGGMIGGIVALSPLVVVSYIAQQYLNTQLLVTIVIAGPVLAAISLGGDLFESWLKRKAGVKDSSRLIPGHGGFFDRFDGVIPVAIVVGIVSSIAT